MKRVIAGCIDLTLEFDSVDECNKYANDIKAKHQTFNILKYEELPGERIRVVRMMFQGIDNDIIRRMVLFGRIKHRTIEVEIKTDNKKGAVGKSMSIS